MANTYLTKTFSSGGNQRIWTVSFWVKLNRGTGDDSYILTYASGSGSTPRGSMEFRSNANGNNFRLGLNPSGSTWVNCDVDNRKFRDYSAWYHVVVAVDTTQATASNRVKIYINGEQETVSTQPDQNFDTGFNHTHQTSFGRYENADSSYFDGVLSHIHFIDGTQYTASSFGSTDSTTGEWKINTNPSVTYGSNGYFILKDGNSVTDQSGNSNNFTVGGGTLTKTEDNPSNVFPIFNGMYCPKSSTNAGAFLNGGTTVGGSPSDASSIASMGARSGKYYWEIKVQNATNTRSCGVVRSDSIATSHGSGIYPGGNGNATIWTVAYNMVNGYVQKNDNGTQSQQGSLATLTTGDILGVALNLTDYEIKWYKNNSLVATTSLSADWVAYGNFLLPCNRMDGNQFVQYNFGNGYFGTTAVASAGTNASGIGIFEYDVPTGFTALSTKGLNL